MADTSQKPNTRGLYIKTYGCQANVYDSERMRDVLKPLGYAPVDSPEAAELVVINTCHIREKASEKVYSELGRLRVAASVEGRLRVAGDAAPRSGGALRRAHREVEAHAHDLDAAHETMQRATVLVGPRTTFYGAREIFYATPAGPVVAFAEHTAAD